MRVALFLCGILMWPFQSALAVPMSFNISQSGFTGGGSITGSFTGDDLDMNGTISSFFGEVSAFSASWSGNGTLAPTTWSWSLSDLLFALVYELGTGDIGNDALTTGQEGVRVTNGAGFIWNTGNGPGGFGAAPGGGIQGPQAGAIITTSSLVSVSQVPEPGTLALFGLALAGLGFARRRTLAKS